MIGKSIYIALSSLGVEFLKTVESEGSVVMYISVPKSTNITMHGQDNSYGDFLAKRSKYMLNSMANKNVVVKYKVREENWNIEKSQKAEDRCKKELNL